jgi:hypothetical protein
MIPPRLTLAVFGGAGWTWIAGTRAWARVREKLFLMESSTVLAFRIFVMLSCLIIVPLAAIFGSAFPDVVKTVLVDRIVAWSTGKPLESLSTAAPSGFGSVTPAQPSSAHPGSGEAPRWGQSTAQTGESQPSPSSGIVPASAVHPAGGNSAGSYATPADARGAMPSPFGADRGGDASRAAAFENRAGGPPSTYPSAAQAPRDARADPGAPPAVQTDRFTSLERKLREYGATYYLLETWGNDGELYRFHCKMAIGNNPNYTRHFEATDRDALKAMAQVLEKVEGWREGRVQ